MQCHILDRSFLEKYKLHLKQNKKELLLLIARFIKTIEKKIVLLMSGVRHVVTCHRGTSVARSLKLLPYFHRYTQSTKRINQKNCLTSLPAYSSRYPCDTNTDQWLLSINHRTARFSTEETVACRGAICAHME